MEWKTLFLTSTSHIHSKSMKTSRRFTQPNRILSFLRFGSGLTLISAGAAMSFVAAMNSLPATSSKLYSADETQRFGAKLTARDLAGSPGQPGKGQLGDQATPVDEETE